MPSLALKAHFDGKHIQLDEPYPLAPSARLMVLVMPEAGGDDIAEKTAAAAASLNRAYGNDEPEYSLADLRVRP